MLTVICAIQYAKSVVHQMVLFSVEDMGYLFVLKKFQAIILRIIHYAFQTMLVGGSIIGVMIYVLCQLQQTELVEEVEEQTKRIQLVLMIVLLAQEGVLEIMPKSVRIMI